MKFVMSLVLLLLTTLLLAKPSSRVKKHYQIFDLRSENGCYYYVSQSAFVLLVYDATGVDFYRPLFLLDDFVFTNPNHIVVNDAGSIAGYPSTYLILFYFDSHRLQDLQQSESMYLIVPSND
ncbi:MAG: hypothetical protein AAF806_00475 [Bacteroidota bacterium]